MPDNISYWLAKLLSSFAGGALSLAFMAPKNWEDAVVRIIGSLFFGAALGATLVDQLEKHLNIVIVGEEKTIAGAFLCGFVAWPILGQIYKLAGRVEPPKKEGE